MRGPANVDCSGCPLAHNDKAIRAVRGVGPVNPKVILIGEGPGKWEVIKASPFSGDSGRMLNMALANAGLNREEDVYATYTTMCLPPFGADKEKIVGGAVNHCRGRLLAELNALPAVPIVALGRYAASWFLGDDFSIRELSGSYHELNIPGLGRREVIPTLHPASIMRGGTGDSHSPDLLYYHLVYDLAKAAGLASGRAVKFTDDTEIGLKPRRILQLVQDFLPEIAAQGWVAIDTETVGTRKEDCVGCKDCNGHSALDARHARIIAVGLATEKRGISIAWEEAGERAKALVRSVFADPRIGKVFHNRGYDMVVCKANGVPIAGPVDCTLLQHHNAFPGLDHHLQRVATQFFCISPWKSEFRHGQGELKELLKYNSLDVTVTARIKPTLEDCIRRTRSEQTYAMDLKMATIAEQMQHWGIPVSLRVNTQLANYFLPLMAKAEHVLAGALDDDKFKSRFFDVISTEQAKKQRKNDSPLFDDRCLMRRMKLEEKFKFNLNCSAQIAGIMIASGIPLSEVTKSGLLSTKKAILEAWSIKPVVRSIMQWRNLSKLHSTFIKPFPHKVDCHQRLHVDWTVNKITGRWGSSPAVQNWAKGMQKWPKGMPHTFENWLALPEEDKGVPNLRWQVVAPKGYALVGGDMAQLEARAVALLSGDKWLCSAFLEGRDIHSEIAAVLFGEAFTKLDKDDPVRKRLRDIAKRPEYGWMYGAAMETAFNAVVKEGYDIPFSAIERMFKHLRTVAPRVSAWHEELTVRAARDMELRSFLYGRRRTFPMGNAEDTVVKNFTVQSAAADIMNTGVVKFHAARPKHCIPLQQGHDAWVVECKEADAENVAKLMKDCFTQEFTVNGTYMVFPMDVKIGQSWGEL